MRNSVFAALGSLFLLSHSAFISAAFASPAGQVLFMALSTGIEANIEEIFEAASAERAGFPDPLAKIRLLEEVLGDAENTLTFEADIKASTVAFVVSKLDEAKADPEFPPGFPPDTKAQLLKDAQKQKAAIELTILDLASKLAADPEVTKSEGSVVEGALETLFAKALNLDFIKAHPAQARRMMERVLSATYAGKDAAYTGLKDKIAAMALYASSNPDLVELDRALADYLWDVSRALGGGVFSLAKLPPIPRCPSCS